MGRPLNEKYFGNRNVDGEGGEGLTSITIGGTNSGYSAIPTFTIGAPNLQEGTQAVAVVESMGIHGPAVSASGTGYAVNDILTVVGGTGTPATLKVTQVTSGAVTVLSIELKGEYTTLPPHSVSATTGGTGTGATTTIAGYEINNTVITEGGSGYTSAPTITDSPDGTGTFTGVLTTGRENSIRMAAFPTGHAIVAKASIIAQKGSNRYLVSTTHGEDEVTLQGVAATAITDGGANITGVDTAGGTYYITKLTSRVAHVTADTGTQWSTGDKVKWTFDTPILNVSIQILSD